MITRLVIIVLLLSVGLDARAQTSTLTVGQYTGTFTVEPHPSISGQYRMRLLVTGFGGGSWSQWSISNGFGFGGSGTISKDINNQTEYVSAYFTVSGQNPSWTIVGGSFNPNSGWIYGVLHLVNPGVDVVNVSGTNTTDQTLKYQFKDQNGNVLYEVIVPPGGSYSQSIDVTGLGVSDVTPWVYTKSNYGDGEVWEVTDDWSENGLPGTPITPVNTDEPEDVPSTNVVPPSNLPPAPTTSTTPGVNTWSATTAATSDGDRLDKTTYKQGVDKVTVAIEKVNTTLGSLGNGSGGGDGESTLGDDVAGQEFDQEADPVVLPVNKAQVLGIQSKLPNMPAFILPETQSSVSIGFDFTSLGLQSATPMEVDFAEFSPAIAVFKAIVRAVLAVFFAVVATRMIRGAFAG